MALDGIVIANITHELNNKLINGRINKIAQPEKDELILTVKTTNREQLKLLISAAAGLPLVYLTKDNKINPLTAPNFCMLLRKHINNAKIIEITQPNFERIINIKLEHLNELGDLSYKYLIIELMGKHSNIIFCDNEFNIIDSIKRINQFVSSLREVLPGKKYFIPETIVKYNPLDLEQHLFLDLIKAKSLPLNKFIYTSFNGISPIVANEIVSRASLDFTTICNTLEENHAIHLFKTFERFMDDIRLLNFNPNIIYDNNEPVEFSSSYLSIYDKYQVVDQDSVSSMLENFYAHKNAINRIKQKSTDLRKSLNIAIERTSKKYDLQLKQLKDTDNRDKFKVYGELITAYGYNLEPNSTKLVALNYYTNEEITIPLDKDLTPIENAKRYFDRYNKLKRTYDALIIHTKETKDELFHLESIKSSMDNILNEEDLISLRKELADYGYIKKKHSIVNKTGKKQKTNLPKSKPLHFLSSDGYHMYVGKNNYQNDELTFKLANGGDWWFHSKTIPGSHVIVKTDKQPLPASTIEEAARLAAYYSSGRESGKVEIDYTLKKHLKKPNGAKPGFVIYHEYSSILASTNITNITEFNN